jgi:hypothetical protein
LAEYGSDRWIDHRFVDGMDPEFLLVLRLESSVCDDTGIRKTHKRIFRLFRDRILRMKPFITWLGLGWLGSTV